jgi:sterol 3beta-glucosyltransferase
VKIGLQTWGSNGDIRPFLALAGGLRASGHEVSLVVTSVDNKDYSSYGRELGFAISPVGALSYDEKTIRHIMDKLSRSRNPLRQIEMIMVYFFNPLLSEMFEASQSLCRANDLIIGHFLHYPAQAAAERAGKPYATVMLSHGGIYSKHSQIFGVPNLGKWMNPYWWKLYHFGMDRIMGSEVNNLRKRAGLPPVKNIADTVLMSKDLNLVAETSAICRKEPDWPDYHHVCGFFDVPNAAEKWTMPEDLKTFLGSGPPPVFMTVGSMLSLDTSPDIITETLFQGAVLAGCRAIVQSRWDELPDFPDHPRIYKIQKVPHQYIFPSCSAVVHHGGAGTTHSATRHGCPSIVIEHFGDQEFFARELQHLGVAPKVLHRRNITATALARAIRTVLDSPDMKKRAEELSGLMRKENGVKKAVELIENRFVSQ